jgi:hypothetical protein
MPCNASYARFIFGKFFTSTIILYILLFAQNFYSCKKWVLQLLNICSGYERMRCSRIKQYNCRSVVDKKYTNDHVWSFLGFLHCDMIDLPANIVMSSSNRNKISPTGRRRGGHNCLRRVVARIGALVGKVTFLPTRVAPPFIL